MNASRSWKESGLRHRKVVTVPFERYNFLRHRKVVTAPFERYNFLWLVDIFSILDEY